jgi:hypothetical protein
MYNNMAIFLCTVLPEACEWYVYDIDSAIAERCSHKNSMVSALTWGKRAVEAHPGYAWEPA